MTELQMSVNAMHLKLRGMQQNRPKDKHGVELWFDRQLTADEISWCSAMHVRMFAQTTERGTVIGTWLVLGHVPRRDGATPHTSRE